MGQITITKEEMREIVTRQVLECHDSEMTWEKLPMGSLGYDCSIFKS